MTTETPHPGRKLFWTGLLIVVLGIAAYVVQVMVLNIFYGVPWYTPILGTVGVLAMLAAAVSRQWSIFRLVGLTLCAALVALEWYFLVVAMRLPDYAGPAAGDPLPAFTAQRADGTTFTNSDLLGQPTVLLFFRGHW